MQKPSMFKVWKVSGPSKPLAKHKAVRDLFATLEPKNKMAKPAASLAESEEDL